MTVPKVVTPKNLIIAGLIIYLLYISFCNRNVTPIEKPSVIPVPTQREVVRKDSIASQLFKDSVNKIVNYWQSQAKHWENNWNREVKENAELQKTVGDILNESVPDTCEQYKQKAIAEFNKLVLSSKKKDTACSKTITSYKNIVTQKDVLIKKGKDDWRKLKVNFDTALAQQKKLEKYIDKIKPKRELIAGISMLTSYSIFKPQVGVTIGYRTKPGVQLNLTVYTNQQVSLTLTKPFARF